MDTSKPLGEGWNRRDFCKITGTMVGGLLASGMISLQGASAPPKRTHNFVTINESTNPELIYLGNPSIVILPDGSYIDSHTWGGPGAQPEERGVMIFRSTDRGNTWKHIAHFQGQTMSNLFLHSSDLYLMGTGPGWGPVIIRRSTDGGKTWTTPVNENTGLLLSGSPGYHTAPVPIAVYKGRIWRAMELTEGGDAQHNWPCFVMSAPVDADLLKASNWSSSNLLYHEAFPKIRWKEGNMVVTPENNLVNILRITRKSKYEYSHQEKVAMVHVGDDGKTLSFDPENDLIDFPGGKAKFTIRYDEKSGRYWSIINYQKEPNVWRNILALSSSADLRHWIVECVLLRHEDKDRHAWQYVDWQFDGDDIIFVSRTAWGYEGKTDINKNPAHNANYHTFHRIPDFRKARLEK